MVYRRNKMEIGMELPFLETLSSSLPALTEQLLESEGNR